MARTPGGRSVRAPRPPTLAIVTDAIRHDYITPEDAPFLFSLTQTRSHARRLRPNFGFCERAEFFTGTRPDVNGYFCALTLSDGSDFSRWEAALWRLVDWESPTLRPLARRLMRGWFRRIRGISQPIYEIPVRLLPRVALTEDRFDFFDDLGRFSVETIFDVLARERRTVDHRAFASLRRPPQRDPESARALIAALDEPHDLYLLYQGSGDAVGHLHGPRSPERRAMVRALDRRLRQVVEAFQTRHPEGRYVIFGDHGMVDVDRTLTLPPLVRSVATGAGLRVGRDFEIWLDSTLVRLWFHRDRAREALTRWLSTDETMNTHGQVLTPERCREIHVPPPGGIYGDLYWLAHPGVLLWPDFFHRGAPLRGMHGYETHVPEQQTFAVWHHPDGPRLELDEIEGIDICPLLCDQMGIPVPAQCQGVSPLRR